MTIYRLGCKSTFMQIFQREGLVVLLLLTPCLGNFEVWGMSIIDLQAIVSRSGEICSDSSLLERKRFFPSRHKITKSAQLVVSVGISF
jgi:hypothetical protein